MQLNISQPIIMIANCCNASNWHSMKGTFALLLERKEGFRKFRHCKACQLVTDGREIRVVTNGSLIGLKLVIDLSNFIPSATRQIWKAELEYITKRLHLPASEYSTMKCIDLFRNDSERRIHTIIQT